MTRFLVLVLFAVAVLAGLGKVAASDHSTPPVVESSPAAGVATSPAPAAPHRDTNGVIPLWPVAVFLATGAAVMWWLRDHGPDDR